MDRILEFKWDLEKAAANFKKHRISFHSASTVFGDPAAITFNDPDHSMGEHRFQELIGSYEDLGGKINRFIQYVENEWRGR